MRVIGVVDLLDGRAVHARGGIREEYAPVRAVAGAGIPPGDPVALARAYVDRLGLAELYVADLDAILGRPPQDALVAAIAAVGVRLWLDAGATSVETARRGVALGASHVVVGLETLRSFEVLSRISTALGADRVAFSLDLRDGRPVLARQASGIRDDESAEALAARADGSGAGAVIVLDLARVGSGAGIDRRLVARVRDAVPGLTLLAGGGVRAAGELRTLADAGCDGALVATALHDGRVGPADITAARAIQPRVER